MAREGVPQEVPAGLDPVAGRVRGAGQDPGPEAEAESLNVPEVDLPVQMGQVT